ncbi:MAG: trypsin-like peptidase domain-containing protein [Pirellula sp.]
MSTNQVVTILGACLWILGNITGVHAGQVGDCIAIEFTDRTSPICTEMHLATDQAIRDGWVVRRFDAQHDSHIAARWQIQKMPTTVLVRNGREQDRIVGSVSYRELNQRLLAASSPDSLRSVPNASAEAKTTNAPLVRGQSPMALIPMAGTSALTSGTTRFGLDGQSPSQRFDPTASSVRIRVQESHHESVGSGTVIDSHQGEALVLTCGHLFRESQGNAQITIETFIDGQVQTYPAVLIDFQAKETDIGLLTFRPSREIVPVKLIPKNRQLVEGQKVFSVGCDRGAPPNRIDSRITKLNRYLGPANVEVDGQPVEGRSGGGLFDERGELIGVCYAADPNLKEGLYNGAEVVYQQLAKLSLQRLFNERDASSPTMMATSTGPQAPKALPLTESSVEMTVILKDSHGRQETLHIPQPSPVLLQAVRENQRIR